MITKPSAGAPAAKPALSQSTVTKPATQNTVARNTAVPPNLNTATASRDAVGFGSTSTFGTRNNRFADFFGPAGPLPGPIPPQSTDPRIAVHQNHNITHPYNVVGPLSATLPVQVNTPQQVLDQVAMMSDYWAAQPPPRNNLGVFPTVYEQMTQGLMNKAADYLANGETQKAQAVYDVMVEFGNKYFAAFNAYQSGQPVQQPWQFAFDTALQNPPTSVLTNVALGMDAHILNDLPQVLRDLDAAGRPGFDLTSAADMAAFREYNSTFTDTRVPIIAALNAKYPGNDVGQAAAIADQLGVSAPGVGATVDTMRSFAWQLAASPITTPDLGRLVTGIQQTEYAAISAAQDVGQVVQNLPNPVDVARGLIDFFFAGSSYTPEQLAAMRPPEPPATGVNPNASATQTPAPTGINSSGSNTGDDPVITAEPVETPVPQLTPTATPMPQ